MLEGEGWELENIDFSWFLGPVGVGWRQKAIPDFLVSFPYYKALEKIIFFAPVGHGPGAGWNQINKRSD